MAPEQQRRATSRGGFTLVELMVSTAIMLIVILVLLQVIAGMTNIWHNSSGSVSNYQSARAAFTLLTRTISRATLKTYLDYADPSTNPPTQLNIDGTVGSILSASFNSAYCYARCSELQFMAGPSTTMSSTASGTPYAYPGDAIFFPTPAGEANSASNGILSRSLNLMGFFVVYSDISPGAGTSPTAMPTWLPQAMGMAAAAPPSQYRFRLIQYVQPTDALAVYRNSTPPYPQPGYSSATTSQIAYKPAGVIVNSIGSVAKNTAGVTIAYQNILAENVPLLIVRPRLEPQDEVTAYKAITGGTYNSSLAGSVISPNYAYDSRAWLPSGYAYSATKVTSLAYASYMRNQLPPIVDVAMIAVDGNSLVRFGTTTAPPNNVTTLFTTAATGLFTDSTKMDADLDAYGAKLAAAPNYLRYRIFRASVQVEGSAWVNTAH